MPACWGCCCPSKHTWRACAYRRSRCVNWTSITVPIKNVSTVEREPGSEGRWLYCASVCQSHPVLFHPAQRPQSRKLSGTITGGDNHAMELLNLQLWRERSLVGLSRGREEAGGCRLIGFSRFHRMITTPSPKVQEPVSPSQNRSER